MTISQMISRGILDPMIEGRIESQLEQRALLMIIMAKGFHKLSTQLKKQETNQEIIKQYEDMEKYFAKIIGFELFGFEEDDIGVKINDNIINLLHKITQNINPQNEDEIIQNKTIKELELALKDINPKSKTIQKVLQKKLNLNLTSKTFKKEIDLARNEYYKNKKNVAFPLKDNELLNKNILNEKEQFQIIEQTKKFIIQSITTNPKTKTLIYPALMKGNIVTPKEQQNFIFNLHKNTINNLFGLDTTKKITKAQLNTNFINLFNTNYEKLFGDIKDLTKKENEVDNEYFNKLLSICNKEASTIKVELNFDTQIEAIHYKNELIEKHIKEMLGINPTGPLPKNFQNFANLLKDATTAKEICTKLNDISTKNLEENELRKKYTETFDDYAKTCFINNKIRQTQLERKNSISGNEFTPMILTYKKEFLRYQNLNKNEIDEIMDYEITLALAYNSFCEKPNNPIFQDTLALAKLRNILKKDLSNAQAIELYFKILKKEKLDNSKTLIEYKNQKITEIKDNSLLQEAIDTHILPVIKRFYIKQNLIQYCKQKDFIKSKINIQNINRIKIVKNDKKLTEFYRKVESIAKDDFFNKISNDQKVLEKQKEKIKFLFPTQIFEVPTTINKTQRKKLLSQKKEIIKKIKEINTEIKSGKLTEKEANKKIKLLVGKYKVDSRFTGLQKQFNEILINKNFDNLSIEMQGLLKAMNSTMNQLSGSDFIINLFKFVEISFFQETDTKEKGIGLLKILTDDALKNAISPDVKEGLETLNNIITNIQFNKESQTKSTEQIVENNQVSKEKIENKESESLPKKQIKIEKSKPIQTFFVNNFKIFIPNEMKEEDYIHIKENHQKEKGFLNFLLDGDVTISNINKLLKEGNYQKKLLNFLDKTLNDTETNALNPALEFCNIAHSIISKMDHSKFQQELSELNETIALWTDYIKKANENTKQISELSIVNKGLYEKEKKKLLKEISDVKNDMQKSLLNTLNTIAKKPLKSFADPNVTQTFLLLKNNATILKLNITKAIIYKNANEEILQKMLKPEANFKDQLEKAALLQKEIEELEKKHKLADNNEAKKISVEKLEKLKLEQQGVMGKIGNALGGALGWGWKKAKEGFFGTAGLVEDGVKFAGDFAANKWILPRDWKTDNWDKKLVEQGINSMTSATLRSDFDVLYTLNSNFENYNLNYKEKNVKKEKSNLKWLGTKIQSIWNYVKNNIVIPKFKKTKNWILSKLFKSKKANKVLKDTTGTNFVKKATTIQKVEFIPKLTTSEIQLNKKRITIDRSLQSLKNISTTFDDLEKDIQNLSKNLYSDKFEKQAELLLKNLDNFKPNINYANNLIKTINTEFDSTPKLETNYLNATKWANTDFEYNHFKYLAMIDKHKALYSIIDDSNKIRKKYEQTVEKASKIDSTIRTNIESLTNLQENYDKIDVLTQINNLTQDIIKLEQDCNSVIEELKQYQLDTSTLIESKTKLKIAKNELTLFAYAAKPFIITDEMPNNLKTISQEFETLFSYKTAKSAANIAIKYKNLAYFKAFLNDNKIEKILSNNQIFYMAIKNNYLELIEHLINNKLVDINHHFQNKNNNTALHIALFNNQIELAKHLLNYPQIDINAIGNNNSSILHTAIKNNHMEIANSLIKKQNIALNVVDSNDNTLLHTCLKNHKTNLAMTLLQDSRTSELINAIDIPELDTILHLAIKNKQISIIKELLSRTNINIIAKNAQGKTPFDLANESNNSTIIKIFANYSTSEKQYPEQKISIKTSRDLSGFFGGWGATGKEFYNNLSRISLLYNTYEKKLLDIKAQAQHLDNFIQFLTNQKPPLTEETNNYILNTFASDAFKNKNKPSAHDIKIEIKHIFDSVSQQKLISQMTSISLKLINTISNLNTFRDQIIDEIAQVYPEPKYKYKSDFFNQTKQFYYSKAKDEKINYEIVINNLQASIENFLNNNISQRCNITKNKILSKLKDLNKQIEDHNTTLNSLVENITNKQDVIKVNLNEISDTYTIPKNFKKNIKSLYNSTNHNEQKNLTQAIINLKEKIQSVHHKIDKEGLNEDKEVSNLLLTIKNNHGDLFNKSKTQIKQYDTIQKNKFYENLMQLFILAKNGNKEELTKLLSNTKFTQLHLEQALFIAVNYQKTKSIFQLVSTLNESFALKHLDSIKNENGDTLLHIACSNQKDNSNTISYLLRLGADPKAQNNNLQTPLTKAILSKQTKNVDALINSNCKMINPFIVTDPTPPSIFSTIRDDNYLASITPGMEQYTDIFKNSRNFETEHIKQIDISGKSMWTTYIKDTDLKNLQKIRNQIFGKRDLQLLKIQKEIQNANIELNSIIDSNNLSQSKEKVEDILSNIYYLIERKKLITNKFNFDIQKVNDKVLIKNADGKEIKLLENKLRNFCSINVLKEGFSEITVNNQDRLYNLLISGQEKILEISKNIDNNEIKKFKELEIRIDNVISLQKPKLK